MKFSRTYSAPDDRMPASPSSRGPRASSTPTVGDFRGQGHHDPGRLEPGRGRHPRPEVLPQGRRPERASSASPRRACRSGWRRRSTSRRSRPGPRRAVRARDRRPPGLPPHGRHAGRIGAARTATSTPKTTRAPITTRCARCWRARSARPTRRSGSTPACTGRTASRARRKATITSIPPTEPLDASADTYEHPAGQRVFHPGVERRSRQRRRHHGLASREARIFKCGTRHGLEFLEACAARARSSPAAARRAG